MEILVLMQFGDGSHKEITVEVEEREEALQAARDWIDDNRWFEFADGEEA